MNPAIRPILVFGCWALWVLPFIVRRAKSEKPVERKPAARWGILLESAGYFLVYLHSPKFWNTAIEPWRCALGLVLAIPAIVLVWLAIPALGRQWRVDAALNADHELVRSGPYRLVRHPIYASMLGMILAGIAWCGTLPAWPIALVLFLVGLEIRVRMEDSLLRERFGAEFAQWSEAVPAYFPFIR